MKAAGGWIGGGSDDFSCMNDPPVIIGLAGQRLKRWSCAVRLITGNFPQMAASNATEGH
jgi:hypothetical protein